MKIGETLDAEQVVYGSFEFTRPAAGAITAGSLRVTAARPRPPPPAREPRSSPKPARSKIWAPSKRIWPGARSPDRAHHGAGRSRIPFPAHSRPPRCGGNYIAVISLTPTEQKEKYFIAGRAPRSAFRARLLSARPAFIIRGRSTGKPSPRSKRSAWATFIPMKPAFCWASPVFRPAITRARSRPFR